jgi:Ca2+/Na+ antiporter
MVLFFTFKYGLSLSLILKERFWMFSSKNHIGIWILLIFFHHFFIFPLFFRKKFQVDKSTKQPCPQSEIEHEKRQHHLQVQIFWYCGVLFILFAANFHLFSISQIFLWII